MPSLRSSTPLQLRLHGLSDVRSSWMTYAEQAGKGFSMQRDASIQHAAFRSAPTRLYRVRGAIRDAVRQLSPLPRRAHERLAALEAAADVSEGDAEQAFGAGAADPRAARRALEQHLSSVALAAAVGMAAETHGESSSDDGSPEEALSRAELLHVVREALTQLDNADEVQIVERHYYQGERIEDIARDLEMSKSWASRLHTRAIGRLAKRLRGFAG